MWLRENPQGKPEKIEKYARIPAENENRTYLETHQTDSSRSKRSVIILKKVECLGGGVVIDSRII
jgi:hypothetical protein